MNRKQMQAMMSELMKLALKTGDLEMIRAIEQEENRVLGLPNGYESYERYL
jgi:hypothetical protein